MNIIDTHCHLDVTDFDSDRDDVLDRCHAAAISKIIIPAIESLKGRSDLILNTPSPFLLILTCCTHKTHIAFIE